MNGIQKIIGYACLLILSSASILTAQKNYFVNGNPINEAQYEDIKRQMSSFFGVRITDPSIYTELQEENVSWGFLGIGSTRSANTIGWNIPQTLYDSVVQPIITANAISHRPNNTINNGPHQSNNTSSRIPKVFKYIGIASCAGLAITGLAFTIKYSIDRYKEWKQKRNNKKTNDILHNA